MKRSINGIIGKKNLFFLALKLASFELSRSTLIESSNFYGNHFLCVQQKKDIRDKFCAVERFFFRCSLQLNFQSRRRRLIDGGRGCVSCSHTPWRR